MRESLEMTRFLNSWPINNFSIMKKYLKYITINQYTLRIIRSKYFNKQFNKLFLYYGKNQNIFNSKYNMIENFYPIGLLGVLGTDSNIKNKEFFN